MAESAKMSIDRQDFERYYKCMASSHLNQSKDGSKKQRSVFTPIAWICNKNNDRLCTRLDMNILLQ